MTGKPREKLYVVYLRCWRCGHHHYNTCLKWFKPVNTPTSLWYAQPLEYSLASENGMEALELDTASVLGSLPPLEDMLVNSQKLTVVWINPYCEKQCSSLTSALYQISALN